MLPKKGRKPKEDLVERKWNLGPGFESSRVKEKKSSTAPVVESGSEAGRALRMEPGGCGARLESAQDQPSAARPEADHDAGRPGDVVLIVGSTGSLGKPIVAELKRKGVPVRILGRSRESFVRAGFVGKSWDDNDSLVICADVTDRRAYLDEWFHDVSAVVCVARPRWSQPADRVTFEGLVRNLSDAACNAGVPRMLLLGRPYVEDYTFGMTPSMEALRGVEASAWERFESSDSSCLTIARIGEMTEIGHIWEMAQRSNVWICVRGYDPRLQPISARDFAVAVAEYLEEGNGTGWNSELLVAGPQAITWRELGRSISSASGKQLRFIDVPIWTLRGLLYVLHLGGKVFRLFEGVENVLKVAAIPMTASSTSDKHKIVGKDHLGTFLHECSKVALASDVHDRVFGHDKNSVQNTILTIVKACILLALCVLLIHRLLTHWG